MSNVLTLTRETLNEPGNPVRRRNFRILVALSCLCLALLAGVIYASTQVRPFLPPAVASKYMKQWLQEPPVLTDAEGNRSRVFHLDELKRIYRANRNQPIWFDSYELTDAATLFIQSLRETVADDRHLYSYHLPTILHGVSRLSNLPKDVTALDMLITESFITFAQDSMNKHFLPDLKSHDHLVDKPPGIPEEERLTTDHVAYQIQNNLEASQLEALVASLTPKLKGYLQLREQLQHYQNLATSGLWQPMPDGETLSLGDSHTDIRILRNNLVLYKDHQTSTLQRWFGSSAVVHNVGSEHYDLAAQDEQAGWQLDQDLVNSLKRYQSRVGIPVTGSLDPATRKQLQVPPQRIARMISFNMKRWRHLPEELGESYLMVNMADFRMQLKQKGKTELDMKVIVGRPSRRTPTLVESLNTLVVNPTWTVPRRIAVKDILPKIKKDPNYLSRNNLQVLRYAASGKELEVDPTTVNWKNTSGRNLPFVFRQRAGENNALGRVKFMLPNNMAIYLHDTNHPELFKEPVRALSSGCVRLEKPTELAEFLLTQKPGWDASRVERAFSSKRTAYIKLAQPMPVYLLYWTAWVDDQGLLQQRPDVYEWDQLDIYGSDQKSSMLAKNLIDALSP